MSLPVKPEVRPSNAGQPNNIPKIGDWYWVKCSENEEGEETKKEVEYLFCVRHLASNHVVFARCTPEGGQSWAQIRYRDLLAFTRLEPNWKQFKEARIEEKKLELKEAIKALSDICAGAGLIAQENEGASMLPAKIRVSPEQSKKTLTRIKAKTIPEHHKTVERITQEITTLYRDLVLPMRVQSERLEKTVESVDERLFALELYAGLFQKVKQISKGNPAPKETPVTVRQMMRYMDEECLIDYDGGGMDYNKVDDFDEWVVKPENLSRIAPEPRCIVALQIRRYDKDYGTPVSLFHAIANARENQENKRTYLLLRNGENVHRLWADIDFRPQLLPDREEFTRPFEEVHTGWYNFEKKERNPDKIEEITPDHLDYDKHVAERKKLIFRYNRIMFLIQGLLDRSDVFNPHPPINLGDQEHVKAYLRLVFDSEALPAHNPPKWEEYRNRCNASIKPGSTIWTRWYDEDKDYDYNYRSNYRSLKPGRARPDILTVDKVKRDRSQVCVSWPWGTRWGYEFRTRYWSGYGRWGEWEVKKRRRAWIPIQHVFHLEAYKPGDFKQFLCDAYQKGRYLEWAPQLLNAEKWHHERQKSNSPSYPKES